MFKWLICWLSIILGVFSSFWLIDKFTAESYQYGDLSEVSSNLIFIIQTDTMLFVNDSTKIEKEFESIYQVCSEFDAEKHQYKFTMNGSPVANAKINNGQIAIDMDVTFLNTDGSDKKNDILTVRIDFFSNKTKLLLETKDAEAVAYWNTYFNSYGFDLRVYKLMEVEWKKR